MKALPKIPEYELLTCLGGGLLTSVYAARFLPDDQACAIKLLRPEWDDQPVAVKLLQREARALLAVRHPHLVSLLEAHVLKPPYFLVMDMLPGEALRRRLRRDYQLDTRDALWITRQCAEALAALHRAGFAHGDVKPDNIRIAAEGRAILLDLGFAHRPGENSALLEEGYILGTANYLAPELCGPKPRDDVRADVFSLGVMLFELLTGRLPYEGGPERETLRRHLVEAPADLEAFLPNPPRRLAELLDRLLAHEPDDRPSAALLVQELIELEIAHLGRRRAA